MMGQETAETRTSELFPNDYQLNFTDESESPNELAANPVSPRSLSKPHFPKLHTVKGTPVQQTLLRPNSDYILRSAINLENNSAAIRLRNFSFPTDLQHDDGASGQELRHLSSFNNLNQSKPLSRGSHQSPQTSVASYSNSILSSPRRATRSGTNSSISSPSNCSATYTKDYYGNGSDAVGDHIQREHDSEHLFNHLRFCTISSENNNHMKCDEGLDKARLKPAFVLHSRKSSVDSPTRKLQDFKKRRSSSLISGSSSSTIPSTTQQSSPRSYHHKRASAMTDSQNMVSFDNLTLNELKSDSDININGSTLRNHLEKEEQNHYDRNIFLDDHATEVKRNYYGIPSPKLTIANTKEQIRRNSNGQFGTFREFMDLHGLQQDTAVFASLPETGDDVSDSKINLDHIHDFKLQVSPRSKKCKPHFGQRLSIAISEEASSIESSSSRDDEMLTLMDFLNSE